MARLQDIYKWRDVSAGNIQKVSSDIIVPNSVPFSMNLLFDRVLGEAESRQGVARLAAQIADGHYCLGLFQHLDSSTVQNKLFAGFQSSIFDVLDESAVVNGLTENADQNYVTFLNTTLMLNGYEKRAYTAAGGWVSSGSPLDVDNIPAGAQFPIEFKDRVYAAVVDTLHYTAVANPTLGTVSWNGSGSGTLQVEREDGGGTIQALNKVPGYLLIYKQRTLKRWNFDSSFPEDLINIGTQSHKSVVRARGRNYFFYGPNGFYETEGSYPKLISRPVQRIIEGISSAFYSKINGWSDNDHIYWSIGDITVDFGRGYTESYNNVVLRYTIDTQQWAPLQYAHEFYAMGQYIVAADTLIIAGDEDGQVFKLNVGNTDHNNTPIKYLLQSPEFDFDNREFYKTISEKIYVHSDLTIGALLQVRLDYGEWESVGSLKDIVTEIQIQSLYARVFEFRIVDSITGEQVKLRGLDFPNVDVHQQ